MNQKTFCDFVKNCDKKELSDKINVSMGAIRSWIKNNHVPKQYTFELYKIIKMNIDYTQYTYREKDQFFTSDEMVKRCWEIVKEKIVDYDTYTYIEPSAGDGSFMSVLPNESIFMDVEPRKDGIMAQDFLEWKPEQMGKYIVIGNPPFGLRGHLALNFINHSQEFADHVCFILPQLFSSDGKGSPSCRVRGYGLLYSTLMEGLFHDPGNNKMKINCVFQIWSKNHINQKTIVNNSELIKVYFISNGKSNPSISNMKMIDKCDIYLPSTCFGVDRMRVYEKFDDLPFSRGYGVVFDDKDMIQKAKNIDWGKVCYKSTNSACNLRKSVILNKLFEEKNKTP